MGTSPIAYRVATLSGDGEEWFDDAAAADVAVAQRLGLTSAQLEPLRRRVTVDPVVVRRDGDRWRSRQVWTVRSDTGTIRIYEMLHIDEAVYDH